jgi:hypothetical protein
MGFSEFPLFFLSGFLIPFLICEDNELYLKRLKLLKAVMSKTNFFKITTLK